MTYSAGSGANLAEAPRYSPIFSPIFSPTLSPIIHADRIFDDFRSSPVHGCGSLASLAAAVEEEAEEGPKGTTY